MLAALPAALFSSGNFSLWGGYSYSAMTGADRYLSSLEDNYGPAASRTSTNNGITFGLDGAYWYYSWWGIGGRISYTYVLPAYAEGMEAGNPVKTEINSSLCQLQAGVPLLFEFCGGAFSAGGGIYAGLGAATANRTQTGGLSSLEGSVSETRLCFTLEVPVRFTWHISSSFLLDLNAGFRMAEADGTAYAAGFDPDFSGFTAGLGFNWRFSSHDWPWYEKKW